MKLRNKKTGEIGLVHCDATMFSNKIGVFIDNNHIDLRNPYKIYTSLAELNDEWEDYEEPKEYWYINEDNEPQRVGFGDPIEDIENLEEIGLLFKTEEETKKAIEKLKAWKRLKDKGFRFEGWEMDGTIWFETKQDEQEWSPKYRDDLDLLFGEEEE